MNTNQNIKRILCFGDSNTWGLNPETKEKYPAHIRWTGVLQDFLGDSVEIIEEGLRSRTTNIDDAEILDRNGLTYLRPCLETHTRLDVCILWLGTNDLKSRFHRTAENIAEGIRDCILEIQERIPKTRIIIIAPPHAYETKVSQDWGFTAESVKESLKFTNTFSKIATEKGVSFVSLDDKDIKPSEIDGIHLSLESHRKVAEIFNNELNLLS